MVYRRPRMPKIPRVGAGRTPRASSPRLGASAGNMLRPGTPQTMVNVGLVVVLAAIGVTAYLLTSTKSTAQVQVTTGTVQKGSVLSTVSASGNIQPAKTVSLSFQGTGKLVAVYVKPGQHVAQSQVLAKLVDSSEAAAVRTAQANLASAQANLTSAEQPLTPETAKQNQIAVEQSQTAVASQQAALRDTVAAANQDRQTLQRDVVAARTAANQDRQSLQRAVVEARAAVSQARKSAAANTISLHNAVGEAKGSWLEAQAAAGRNQSDLQTALDQANAQLARDQAQLTSDQNDVSTYTSQVSNTTGAVNAAQAQVDGDNSKIANDKQKQHKDGCDLNPAPQPKCANDAYQLSKDQTQLSNDQSKLSTAQTAQKTAQSSLDSATSAVSSDQTKTVSDQTAITNAQNAITTGQLKNNQSANQAYRSYVNAQAAYKAGLVSNQQSIQSAQNGLKAAIASLDAGKIKDQQSITAAIASLRAGKLKDQQSITSARSSIKSAKQALASTIAANAVKAAPATAGDLANARAQITSAEASLANAIASLKQQTMYAPTFGTVATVSGSVGENPGSPFITLVDLQRPEVLAGFSESDAAKIHTGQPATVQVDALPTKQLAAHVISIDTTQTVVSNVVTYGVTLVLDRVAPGLKPGMTVSASIVTAKRDGVLHVPNAAVHTTNGSSFVTVVGTDGKQTEQAVQTGLVGDDTTEIVSGVKAGQQVVVSTITTSTTTTPATGGRGGAGGGGFGFPGGGLGG